MIQTACQELRAAGVDRAPEVVVADAGYWKTEAIEALVAQGIRRSSRPMPTVARTPARTDAAAFMTSCAASLPPTTAASSTHAARRPLSPSSARSSTTAAPSASNAAAAQPARSEWRLLAATHNILKLWRHNTAAATA